MSADENKLDDEMLNMTKKKKSKKRINRDLLVETNDNVAGEEVINDATPEETGYTYGFLLNRAFAIIAPSDVSGCSGAGVNRLSIPVPIVARIGTIRTSLVNFGVICKYIKRQEKCLYDYFVTETGQKVSIDANHSLIIKGRYSQKEIESILSKFIKEYVLCKACRSPHTTLGKLDRITMLKCETCNSQSSVSTIKTGFTAQVRRRPRAN